jgi:hypothetical protein
VPHRRSRSLRQQIDGRAARSRREHSQRAAAAPRHRTNRRTGRTFYWAGGRALRPRSEVGERWTMACASDGTVALQRDELLGLAERGRARRQPGPIPGPLASVPSESGPAEPRASGSSADRSRACGARARPASWGPWASRGSEPRRRCRPTGGWRRSRRIRRGRPARRAARPGWAVPTPPTDRMRTSTPGDSFGITTLRSKPERSEADATFQRQTRRFRRHFALFSSGGRENAAGPRVFLFRGPAS